MKQYEDGREGREERGGRGGGGEGGGGGGEGRRGLTHKQTVKALVPVLERLHKDVLCLVYN